MIALFDVEAVREEFPIFKRYPTLIYMDSACTTLKPQRVIDAVAYYYSELSGCSGRSIHKLSTRTNEAVEDAREKVAEFINAKTSEIIWTKNTSESINLVANSLTLRREENIVTTYIEHHSNLLPWQFLTKKFGAELRFIKVDSEGEIDISQAEKIIDPKTRLVAISHTSNVLGTSLPVEEIRKIAHDNDALVLADGAQSVPHFPVDVKKLGVDFLAFSGHKMCGPTGIGALYGRGEILEELPPAFVGGGMIKTVSFTEAEVALPPQKFEAGVQNYAGIIGLSEAVKFLESIGMQNIEKHEKTLMELLLNKVSDLDFVKIYGPLNIEKKIGILPFNIVAPNGEILIDPHDLAIMMDEIADIEIRSGMHCVEPFVKELGAEKGTARTSLYLYNKREEIKKFTETLEEIHTFIK
jgi:cysteine desulfurase/selenocysteine lyase